MQLIPNNTFSSLDCYFYLRFPSWHNHFNTSPPSLHPHLKAKTKWQTKIVNIYYIYTSSTHLIGTGHPSQHWVHFLQFLKYVCTILNHGRDKFDRQHTTGRPQHCSLVSVVSCVQDWEDRGHGAVCWLLHPCQGRECGRLHGRHRRALDSEEGRRCRHPGSRLW